MIIRRIRSLAARVVEALLLGAASAPPVRRALARRAKRALAQSHSPLFVCYGNLNRSAFAAALARERWRVATVDEAGYYPVGDRPSSSEAIAAARDHGVELASHRSAVLAAPQVKRSDAIFVFDVRNLLYMATHHPRAVSRLHLLAALGSRGPVAIGDPHGGAEDVYAEVFGQIDAAIAAGARLLERG